MSLGKPEKSVSECKRNSLGVCLYLKTDKDDNPFICIVTERGTGQHQVSRFLQKHLSAVKRQDPFATKHSLEMVSYFKKRAACWIRFFS